MGRFAMAGEDEIRRGLCTDIYFERAAAVLDAEGINPAVSMEVTAAVLPDTPAVFCGLSDVITLLEGVPVSVEAMEEGTLFYPGEPVLRISGRYRDFARFETAILGFLCHASGVATAAAWIRAAAGEKKVFSFGSRRQHPAIAPMIERSAWIGGVDGVSNTAAMAGIPLAGTMPHAFVMCYPTVADAFASFNKYAPSEVPRVMLADTWCDEKRESLTAALNGAEAVRLDTPRSRRGDMEAILREVRWELDAAGYQKVRIFLSGGITRNDIIRYRGLVDAFGVGGAIANAPVIDFAMDIIEKEGVNSAKRGKRSGRKMVWIYPDGTRVLLPVTRPSPEGAIPLLFHFIEEGRVIASPSTSRARERVLGAIPLLSSQGVR